MLSDGAPVCPGGERRGSRFRPSCVVISLCKGPPGSAQTRMTGSRVLGRVVQEEKVQTNSTGPLNPCVGNQRDPWRSMKGPPTYAPHDSAI